jgi:mycofactocin precursor peptide peptidase
VRAAREVRRESGRVLVRSVGWNGDARAGRTEIFLQLAAGPGHVRFDCAEAGDRRPIGDFVPVIRTEELRVGSANGVLGDPAGATRWEGADLLFDTAADAVDRCTAWNVRPRP